MRDYDGMDSKFLRSGFFQRIGSYKNLSPQSTQRTSRSERDHIIQKTKFKKSRSFFGLSILIILCVLPWLVESSLRPGTAALSAVNLLFLIWDFRHFSAL